MKYIVTILIGQCCVGAQQNPQQSVGAACTQLYQAIPPKVANQAAAKAERKILAAAASGPGPSCGGLVLTDLATDSRSIPTVGRCRNSCRARHSTAATGASGGRR